MTTLRDYQEAAVTSVLEQWENYRSTLVVAATGTGKTTVFCEIVKRRLEAGRVLILVHREELVDQAFRRLASFGIDADIEQADKEAVADGWFKKNVIVATVQTLISGRGSKRMHRFDPEQFATVICDEAHHTVSNSWRKVLEHFKQNPELRILGVTATPDRADEVALGNIFESVAATYEINNAIADGWLTPVEQQLVRVESLDFSKVRTTAGDLNGGDLAEVMEDEKTLQGIAAATLEIIGDRSAVCFTVTIKEAELLADILNRHREQCAEVLTGQTDKDVRKRILRRFEEGEFQFLCNVGVLTEGWDSARAEVIVQARPTKSRSLYTQMVGRILRPLPGIVDGLTTGAERVEAIKRSGKPKALVVDFTGNAGRHRLITAADILGGKELPEVIERATRAAEAAKKPVDVTELIDRIKRDMEEEERKRLESERRKHLAAKAYYSQVQVDAFKDHRSMPVRQQWSSAGSHFTEKQAAVLMRAGIDPRSVGYAHGKRLIGELVTRPSEKQLALLHRYRINTDGMTRSDASAAIDKLKENNWLPF